MKKLLLILITIVSLPAYSQKSKKPAKASTAKITVLAKTGNLTAALTDQKGSAAFYLLSAKNGKTDSLLVKAIFNKAVENLPSECKITLFTTKGQKLHLLSWNEKSTTGDVKSKQEITTETHSQVWDVAAKKMVYANVNKVINITEIVFLDPGKNASKTVEKVRRDGFEFGLTTEGDITLKNKTQQEKLSYDAAEKKYVGFKSAQASKKK